MDDLVLPNRVLRALDGFVDTARQGHTRSIGKQLKRMAAVMLLKGPSGVGKSMTAGALAQALNRPLLTAPALWWQSSWPDESEKTLCRLFEKASAAHAMLLFEGGDWLFQKETLYRGDVTLQAARQALMQQLDRHEGVVIFTVSGPITAHSPLLQRMSATVELPAFDQGQRAGLLESLLKDRVALSQTDFKRLASIAPLTGRDIVMAVCAADQIAQKSDRTMQIQDVVDAIRHRAAFGVGCALVQKNVLETQMQAL
jgi:SpoVK/Ycf46/Vps4 family AAA+-type ATPase